MRLAFRVLWLAAGAALLWIVARSRIGPALELLTRAGGFKLLWLVPLHLLPLLLDAAGWRALLPYQVKLRTLLWIAAIREAVNRLLPVGNVGGDLLGIQLLSRRLGDAAAVTASVLIETLLTMVTQLVFALVGAVCLVLVSHRGSALKILALPAVCAVVLIAALWTALQTRRFFARLWARAARLFPAASSARVAAGCARIDSAIERSRTAPARWVIAAGWQLCGWLLGSLETWVALRFLNHPVGLAPAIALEGLAQAARSLLFFVPAGLGVQELSLLVVGQLLGLPSELALALSLAKRMREVLLGLPVLALCYVREGARGLKFSNVREAPEPFAERRCPRV